MKVAICGDMHWGARGDSEVMHDHFTRFVDEVLIPNCLSRGITEILQVGDFFDRRKFVNFHTLEVAFTFVQKLQDAGINLTVLIGNHDIYFKNTVEINSPDLLLRDRGVKVIDKPTQHLGMTIIPWICEENEEEVRKYVAGANTRIVAGHFEFVGFSMYRGVLCEHGQNHREFSKFDLVLSGHFHTRSIRDNVHYVGTPYDIVWSDFGDEKGFLVIDPETLEEEWIPNPHSIHRKVIYQNGVSKESVTDIAGKYVKVVVEECDDEKKLEKMMKWISEQGSANVTVVDNRLAAETLEDFEGVSEKDPITALTDEIQVRYNGDQLQSLLVKSNELYQEALTSVEEIA